MNLQGHQNAVRCERLALQALNCPRHHMLMRPNVLPMCCTASLSAPIACFMAVPAAINQHSRQEWDAVVHHGQRSQGCKCSRHEGVLEQDEFPVGNAV